MSQDRLKDYIEVPDRIREFKEKFPEGSLACHSWYLKEVGEQTFIVYTALAYRKPDDPRPGEGTAWEPFPGLTPYTKNSELMNAETSAWGRALASLGFVGKKIATREEVEARQGEREATVKRPSAKEPKDTETLASPAQRRLIFAKASEAGLEEPAIKDILKRVANTTLSDRLPAAKVDDVLEAIKAAA